MTSVLLHRNSPLPGGEGGAYAFSKEIPDPKCAIFSEIRGRKDIKYDLFTKKFLIIELLKCA